MFLKSRLKFCWAIIKAHKEVELNSSHFGPVASNPSFSISHLGGRAYTTYRRRVFPHFLAHTLNPRLVGCWFGCWWVSWLVGGLGGEFCTCQTEKTEHTLIIKWRHAMQVHTNYKDGGEGEKNKGGANKGQNKGKRVGCKPL